MVYRRWYATHHRVSTPQTASVNIQDEQNPSETPILVKPDSKPPFNYEPTQPKIISLPSINKEGYIQNVGVNSANSVGVPSNIHLAGWYTKCYSRVTRFKYY